MLVSYGVDFGVFDCAQAVGQHTQPRNAEGQQAANVCVMQGHLHQQHRKQTSRQAESQLGEGDRMTGMKQWYIYASKGQH